MILNIIFFAVTGALSLFEIVYIIRWINGGVTEAGCPGLFFLFGVILIFMISYILDIRDSKKPNRYRYYI